jgi:hypothetical protein
MNPRMEVVNVELRAFWNCRSAISSLIRLPLFETIIVPIARTSSATGVVWCARRPGTHVGRVAMIRVVNRIPRPSSRKNGSWDRRRKGF